MGGIALLSGPKPTMLHGRKVRWMFAGGALLIAMAMESACGGGSPVKPLPHGGTPAGVYTVMITGTAGNTPHSATTNLTVE